MFSDFKSLIFSPPIIDWFKMSYCRSVLELLLLAHFFFHCEFRDLIEASGPLRETGNSVKGQIIQKGVEAGNQKLDRVLGRQVVVQIHDDFREAGRQNFPEPATLILYFFF